MGEGKASCGAAGAGGVTTRDIAILTMLVSARVAAEDLWRRYCEIRYVKPRVAPARLWIRH